MRTNTVVLMVCRKPRTIHQRRIATISLQNIRHHDASSIHIAQRQTHALLRMDGTHRSHHRIYIPRPIQILVATRNQPHIHHQSPTTRILWRDNINHKKKRTQTKRFTHDYKRNERRNNDSQPNHAHQLRLSRTFSTNSTRTIHTSRNILDNVTNHHIHNHTHRPYTQQNHQQKTNTTTTNYATIIA